MFVAETLWQPPQPISSVPWVSDSERKEFRLGCLRAEKELDKLAHDPDLFAHVVKEARANKRASDLVHWTLATLAGSSSPTDLELGDVSRCWKAPTVLTT
jgi:hypothetical protein